MNLRTANKLDGGPSFVDTCIYTHLTQIIFQNRVAVTLCLPSSRSKSGGNQAVDRCPVRNRPQNYGFGRRKVPKK